MMQKNQQNYAVVIFSLIVTLALAYFVSSCTTLTKSIQTSTPTPKIRIMTYNVENLFDISHDEGKDDYAYLPLNEKQSAAHKRRCNKIENGKYRDECLNLDWNEQLLNRKMERLAVAIEQFEGQGPDVLLLEEVENLNVLQKLNKEFLKKSGYQTVVLIEGADPRGIDCGLLSRLPQVGEAKMHPIPFVIKENKKSRGESETEGSSYRDFRGILQVDLKLPDEELLTVFVAHFPSTSNPRYLREQAIEFLAQLKSALPSDRVVIAGGDFNVVKKEEDEYGLISEKIAKTWLVSHLIGCKDCKGTNYFSRENTWSFLDLLLFNPEMGKEGKAKWEVNPSSIRIANESLYQVSKFLTPERFNDGAGPRGVSDHWPMTAEIQQRVLVESPQ